MGGRGLVIWPGNDLGGLKLKCGSLKAIIEWLSDAMEVLEVGTLRTLTKIMALFHLVH